MMKKTAVLYSVVSLKPLYTTQYNQMSRTKEMSWLVYSLPNHYSIGLRLFIYKCVYYQPVLLCYCIISIIHCFQRLNALKWRGRLKAVTYLWRLYIL